MASYNIPEEIVGIPLFVPNDYDFFSIETAGLPNGDDCLKIHGATNSNYKAFQAAQTLSPNVFLSRTSTWSMTFWVKGPNAGGAASNVGENMLFGVMRADCATASLEVTSCVWGIGETNAGGERRIWYTAGASGSRLFTSGATINTFWNSTWQMVTITSAGTVTGNAMYLNDVVLPIVTAGVTVTAPLTTQQYFCIGSYSDLSTLDGWDQDWYLGKLCFHDHVLNATERALLYNAMTT